MFLPLCLIIGHMSIYSNIKPYKKPHSIGSTKHKYAKLYICKTKTTYAFMSACHLVK